MDNHFSGPRNLPEVEERRWGKKTNMWKVYLRQKKKLNKTKQKKSFGFQLGKNRSTTDQNQIQSIK